MTNIAVRPEPGAPLGGGGGHAPGAERQEATGRHHAGTLDLETVLEVTDLVAPCVPTGFAAGRIGNFINGELWGRPADPALPWAMIFPQSVPIGVEPVARHPSQLYQFGLEGLLLFGLLWWYARSPRAAGRVSGAFLIGYGIFRFIAEYFREPDSFLGLLALGMSMGQWLCLPMVAVGLWLWFRAKPMTGA